MTMNLETISIDGDMEYAEHHVCYLIASGYKTKKESCGGMFVNKSVLSFVACWAILFASIGHGTAQQANSERAGFQTVRSLISGPLSTPPAKVSRPRNTSNIPNSVHRLPT